MTKPRVAPIVKYLVSGFIVLVIIILVALDLAGLLTNKTNNDSKLVDSQNVNLIPVDPTIDPVVGTLNYTQFSPNSISNGGFCVPVWSNSCISNYCDEDNTVCTFLPSNAQISNHTIPDGGKCNSTSAISQCQNKFCSSLSVCGKSIDGLACTVDSDCSSGHCNKVNAGSCSRDYFGAGDLNQWGQPVLCPGTCGKTVTGGNCQTNLDCMSGNCLGFNCY